MSLPRGKIGLIQYGPDYRLNVCKLLSNRQLAKFVGVRWRQKNSGFISTCFILNAFTIRIGL
jgi:hypothetical protein